MPTRRRPYTTKHARQTSRRVNESTLGTHVQRRTPQGQASHSRNRYAQAVVRRARIKRAITLVVLAAIVVGVAVAAGLFVFRTVVGGEMTLRDSNAAEALVPVKSEEPSYVLVTAELGAVAEPLETAGPDVILLARLDQKNGKLALVNVPAGLQVTTDNKSESIGSIAQAGDAELIAALSTNMKIDISHFLKVTSEDDLAGIVDALGGVTVDVTQAVDDPHAGHVCIPAGAQRLDGQAALVFMRADNLEYGAQDRLVNQLKVAVQVICELFSKSGAFATRLESIDSFFQTDYSYGDLEAINSWLGGVQPSDVSTALFPGDYAVVTNVTGVDEGRFVSSSSAIADLVKDLEDNVEMDVENMRKGELADPSSFTVEVQNGTSIEGAASAAADELRKAGFKVGDVGNAEQPVYGETLVVYKGSDTQGPARARAVINALGSGRAVDDSYYTLKSDVLLIIGSDNKPVS